jgi:lysophospholipase L1-like esterase
MATEKVNIPVKQSGQSLSAAEFNQLAPAINGSIDDAAAAKTVADAAQPKENGKGLSTNDYTTAEKSKLAGVATGATAYTDVMAVNANASAIAAKVDKITGKQLSTEDYTTTEKTKLAGVATGATANSSDATLLNRANHTGSQAIGTVSGLQPAIDAKQENTNGMIYSKSYFADLSDFTMVGTGFTANNGVINFQGSAGNFANYLLLNNKFTTDENLVFEVEYRQNAAPSATTQGLSVGLKSSNTVAGARFSVAALFGNGTTANTQIFNPETGASITGVVTNAASNHTPGEVLKLTLSRTGSMLSVVAQKMGVAPFGQNAYNSLTTAATWSLPNNGQLAIFGNGGNIDILSINIYSKTSRNNLALFIGDSKTYGLYANSLTTRYPNLVGQYYGKNVAVFAGSGDETKDALLSIDGELAYCKAKYGIINIGRNDAQRGVSAATYQANYTAIRNKIVAAGLIPVHLLPIPETSYDQTALKAWIVSTFASDAQIDPSVGWSNTTMLNADGVHPTVDGMRYIAKRIIDSGVLVP